MTGSRDIRKKNVTFLQCMDSPALILGTEGTAAHDIKLAAIKPAEVSMSRDLYHHRQTRHGHHFKQSLNQLLILLVQVREILREFGIRQHHQPLSRRRGRETAIDSRVPLIIRSVAKHFLLARRTYTAVHFTTIVATNPTGENART